MKKGINNPGFRALPSSVQNNIISNMKYGGRKYNNGGGMRQLTEFDEGGRHEENGLGGIPQGMNPSGQMNLVEEGETKFDAENYIFSDTLKIDKELAKAFNLSPKMVGKTFADASKIAGRKKSKREGDAIETAANEANLMSLMEAQEAFKQKEVAEKLEEINELDPNALPTLMGQGQDPNMMQDPTMGGQMQEAPMMEQEAMMAQQGGPSPEEMAMMEQQMMGQQEGMMRGGGYMTRSYQPGGFMGMNMANAGMMNTGAMGATGTSGDPTGCLCMDGTTNPGCCGEGYDVTNPGVRPIREARIENSFWDYENVDRQGDPVLRKGEGDFQGSFGRFTRNRRLPGRHRRTLQKYDVNYAQTNPGTSRGMIDNPAIMTNIPSNMPANFANIDLSQYTPEQQEIIKSKSKLLSMDGGEHNFEQMYPGLLSKQDRKQIGKVRKALNWESQQIPLGYDVEKKDRPPKDPTGKYSDNFYDRNQKRIEDGKLPKTLEFDRDVFGWLRTRLDPRLEKMEYFPTTVRQHGPFKGGNKWTWREGKGRPKIKQFGGNLLGGGLAQQGFNLNQGLGSQMRRGGKLCYGCGGKMHAYGGRINGIPYATGGEIVAGIGSGLYGLGEGLLDTLTFGLTDELTDRGYDALQEIGPMKGEDNVGDAIRGGANAVGAAGGAVLTGGATTGSAIQQGSKGTGDMLGAIGEETGNETLGKIGQGVEMGGQVVGMVVGNPAGGAAKGAGTGASSIGDAASTASDLGGMGFKGADLVSATSGAGDAAQFGSKIGKVAGKVGGSQLGQMGMNTATQTLSNFDAKKEEERLAEEERKRIAREKMMTNDPNSPYYDPLGGYPMRAGGGLWANIRAKKERMGKNYRPAQPGDKDYPTEKAIKAAQKQMGGSLNQYTTDNTFDNGGKLTLVKQMQQPDGTTVQKSVTYNSLQELLADKEMVMKYGGPENVKELFAARFKDASVPYQATLMDNTSPPAAVVSGGNQEMMQEEAQMQMNPMTERLNYMQQSLQVNPEDLAELEAIKNLERAVDTENPVFTPDPRFTKDSNENDIPDYLEKSGDFEEEIEDNKEKEERIEEIRTKTEKQDDEIPVDTDLSDAKFDFEYKESFPQFASKMIGPLYNIGEGLLSKPKDYNPDFIPVDVPKFDPTQALSNVKRQVSGLRKQLNKVGANPSNLLALAQSGSRLENETLMTYDKLQKELDFRGEQYNKGQKQQLEKYKKQLEMSFDEAKRKSIQEGIKQFSEMQQTEAANYLAAQYNAMAAPNLGTFSYTPFLQGLFNKNNKKKKDK